MDLVTLQSGGVELTLCPRFGGAVARCRYRGQDVLRPAGTALPERGELRDASSFPLVPFSGRIRDGRFRFRGEDYRLEPNFAPEPHAIHGQGWHLPWEVVHAAESYAELVLEHRVPDTPLHYRAVQTFTLDEGVLEAAIGVTNTGDKAMPAGIGLHPYFVRTPGVTLQTTLDHVWLADEANIPRERVPLPEPWDFSRPLEVSTLEMDNGFGGWDRRAQLFWPELGLKLVIEADPVFSHLVIFIPPGQDFFCVEPVSHANNGFNLLDDGVEGTGVAVLGPGERLEGLVRFRIDAGSP